MRVFLTGATGFIGSAIVQELLAAGHQVLGLARNDAAADSLSHLGITAHRGDLADPASLVTAARACDGVIHTAFIHDFSAYAASVETDRVAVHALARALDGSGKPFVITSGTAMVASVASGRTATEEDTPAPGTHRAEAEAAALAAANHGVRSSVVRLSPTVHGAGDHGFVPMLIGIARSKGVSAYIGDGANLWPAVHRLDAARLYRLALEQATPAARLHGVAEEGIPMRSIAETIGAGLGLPVRSLTQEEAQAHFEWMARFVALDNPTSSAATRKTFEWIPKGPDLLTDLKESGYFARAAHA